MYPFQSERMIHTPRTKKPGIEEIEMVVSGRADCEKKKWPHQRRAGYDYLASAGRYNKF
jgi:hypothetical protein